MSPLLFHSIEYFGIATDDGHQGVAVDGCHGRLVFEAADCAAAEFDIAFQELLIPKSVLVTKNTDLNFIHSG